VRLIATETGRVLQLIVMEEIRPPSGVYMPDLFQRIVERYSFVAAPTPQNTAEAISRGAKFNHGRLITPSKTIVISELGFYNDGIIVDAVNTDDAEYVVRDFTTWAMSAFGLREPRTIIPPRFTSIVTVEFDKEIELMMRGINIIAAHAAGAFNHSYQRDIEVKLLRLSVNADPGTVSPLLNTQFFIERRIQRPYTENRYQAGAPLRTEDHIAMLGAIETALIEAAA
jgi:hypothetical protein